MKTVLAFSAIVLAFAGVALAAGDDTPISTDDLFKKLDTNQDGKLTASEIPPEHRKFFERLVRIGDADKNGELTREEFDRALKQTEEPVTDINKVGNLGAGPPAGKMDPKRVFQALDKNKDGKLTRDELEGRPRLLALFDKLGKDELTLEDVAGLLKGKPNGKKAKKHPAKGLAKISETDSPEMSGNAQNHPLPALFKLLDTNHDGRLSEEELAKAGELFEKLDRNHDGFIDAQEFLAASPAASEKNEEASTPAIRPGKRFAKFRNPNRFVQMIMRADADGDGKISMEEAPPQLKKHFAKIDTNGDGYLERSEIEAWIKHHQKRLNAAAEMPNSETPTETKKQPSGF